VDELHKQASRIIQASCVYGPSWGIVWGGQGRAAARASVQPQLSGPNTAHLDTAPPRGKFNHQSWRCSIVHACPFNGPFLRPLSENEVVAARRCAELRLP
jgi:hypothetical protein